MVVLSRDIIGMGRDGGQGVDFWAMPLNLFSFFVGGEMFALVRGWFVSPVWPSFGTGKEFLIGIYYFQGLML